MTSQLVRLPFRPAGLVITRSLSTAQAIKHYFCTTVIKRKRTYLLQLADAIQTVRPRLHAYLVCAL